MGCAHDEVLVDYDHPHRTISVLLDELVRSDPSTTRAVFQVANPRCARCGTKLPQSVLSDVDPRIVY
jgi:hypothetical protein